MSQAEQDLFVNKHNELRRKVAAGDGCCDEEVCTEQSKYGRTPATCCNPGNNACVPAAKDAIPDLVWDADLAKLAQRWADQCKFGHDKGRGTEQFPDSVGQNVYWRSNGPDDDMATDVTVSWYSEIADYITDGNGDPNKFGTSKSIKAVGHFTQVVWQETTHIGCGYTEGEGEGTVVACNYGKAGNMNGAAMYTTA